MTSQEKGKWILRIFTVGLIGIAAAAGVFFSMPKGWMKETTKEKKRIGLRIDRGSFAQILASKNKLTVVNMMVDGNPDSKKLQDILEKLKKEKYDERVVLAELDVDEEPELAATQGVKKEGFAGHLEFHANGKKLEQLAGQTDPLVVEQTIDRLLAGLVTRIGKDWLPEVPGMKRIQSPDPTKKQPAEPAKPEPAQPAPKP